MGEFGQQSFARNPKVIRNIGITLFVLSFAVPNGGIMQSPFRLFLGLETFISTPFLIFFKPLFCDDPTQPSLSEPTILLNGILWYGLSLGAWLTNFTIFFRLPFVIALVAIALPWIVFIWLFSILVHFIPFYFWALGITFIHASRFLKPSPYSAPEPT